MCVFVQFNLLLKFFIYVEDGAERTALQQAIEATKNENRAKSKRVEQLEDELQQKTSKIQELKTECEQLKSQLAAGDVLSPSTANQNVDVSLDLQANVLRNKLKRWDMLCLLSNGMVVMTCL